MDYEGVSPGKPSMAEPTIFAMPGPGGIPMGANCDPFHKNGKELDGKGGKGKTSGKRTSRQSSRKKTSKKSSGKKGGKKKK